MRTQGRHRAGPARRRHPAVVVCAAVLAVTAVTVATGTGFLRQLQAYEAPYHPGASFVAVGSEQEPPARYAQDPAWRELAENSLTTLHVDGHLDCGVPLLPAEAVSVSRLGDHLDSLAACLDGYWRPRIEASGHGFTPVTVEVFDPAVGLGSACGEPERAVPGVYCPTNRTIYLPSTLTDRGGDPAVWSELRLMAVLAHEYGHHLQEITGILATSRTITAEPSDPHEVTRRIESMATCIGALTQGQMVGPLAVTQGYYAFAITPDSYAADDDHGTAATQARWSQSGFDAGGDLRSCSTFSVPSGAVA